MLLQIDGNSTTTNEANLHEVILVMISFVILRVLRGYRSYFPWQLDPHLAPVAFR